MAVWIPPVIPAAIAAGGLASSEVTASAVFTILSKIARALACLACCFSIASCCCAMLAAAATLASIFCCKNSASNPLALDNCSCNISLDLWLFSSSLSSACCLFSVCASWNWVSRSKPCLANPTNFANSFWKLSSLSFSFCFRRWFRYYYFLCFSRHGWIWDTDFLRNTV